MLQFCLCYVIVLFLDFLLLMISVRCYNQPELSLLKSPLGPILECNHAVLYLKNLIHIEEALMLANRQLLNAALRLRCPFRHCCLPASTLCLRKCRICPSSSNRPFRFTLVSPTSANSAHTEYGLFTYIDKLLQTPLAGQHQTWRLEVV